MLRQNVAATLLNIVCESLISMKSFDKTNMKVFHNYRSSLTLKAPNTTLQIQMRRLIRIYSVCLLVFEFSIAYCFN